MACPTRLFYLGERHFHTLSSGNTISSDLRRIPHRAKSYSRSHDAVIRVFDKAGKMIETHEHAGEFKEW